PDLEPAVVGPAVEARAPALRRLDHVGQAAIAARQDALQERHLGVVPLELDAAPAELAAEEALAGARLLDAELPGPLEGRMRLRRERGDARGDTEAPARGGGDAPGQLGDADDVLLGLAREADHEVQLQAPPPEI